MQQELEELKTLLHQECDAVDDGQIRGYAFLALIIESLATVQPDLLAIHESEKFTAFLHPTGDIEQSRQNAYIYLDKLAKLGSWDDNKREQIFSLVTAVLGE